MSGGDLTFFGCIRLFCCSRDYTSRFILNPAAVIVNPPPGDDEDMVDMVRCGCPAGFVCLLGNQRNDPARGMSEVKET